MNQQRPHLCYQRPYLRNRRLRNQRRVRQHHPADHEGNTKQPCHDESHALMVRQHSVLAHQRDTL